MKATWTPLFFLLCAVGTISLFSCGKADNAQPGTSERVRFMESRGDRPGKIWLGWEIPVREWVVMSSLVAYENGYQEGCKDAWKTLSGPQHATVPPGLDSVCANGRKFYGKSLSYADKMTEFYTRYPSDQDLPLTDLIGMLMASKPTTLEEIHQRVSSR